MTVPPAVRWLGLSSSAAVALLGLAYGITLGLGFLSPGSADDPIGEPYFSLLEILILLTAPAMVVLMAAIHAWSPRDLHGLSVCALAFMSMAAVVTLGVHFTILVSGRGQPFPGYLSFHWPSIPYALDILAWDLLFPLALLFAAPVFGGTRLAIAIRRILVAAGILALLGLGGVILGDMRIRNLGILGYGVLFPIAAALLLVLFRRSHPSATLDR